MLSNLDAWVARGTLPPDSLVPRRGDETGVPAASVRMPAVPGVTWAPGDNPIGGPVDWTDPPSAPVQPYPTMVPAVDADGNEAAGLRLPHLAVPLGTYTGTNVYKDLPSELYDRDGTFIPFARTRADRERRRSTAFAGRTLWQPRRLRSAGQSGGRHAGCRPAAAAGGRGALYRRGCGQRPVLKQTAPRGI